MQPDLPPPAPPPSPPPPALPPHRPPVPGWLWLTFGFGAIPLMFAYCVQTSGIDSKALGIAVVAGVFLGFPLVGGLALAARFVSDTATRIIAGIAFAAAILVGLAALCFAGCVCVMNQGHHGTN